jgi:hypothetical protein
MINGKLLMVNGRGRDIRLALLPFLLTTNYLLSITTVFAAPGDTPAGKQQLTDLFTRIINLSAEGAFIVLFIMLIVAGIRFLTSGGDPKALTSASGTLTWALLGVVFMAIAWLLLRLIENFTNVPVTNFCIGFWGCS